MSYQNRSAKINVRVLVALLVVVAAGAAALVVARQVQRQMYSAESLALGQAAFEKEDWPEAVKHFRAYLTRNPDDVTVLRQCGEAALSIRPLDARAISGAISAYRRIVQLDPRDEAACEKLVLLYAAVRNYAETASVARLRLERDPNDKHAPLWLADALVCLNRPAEAQQTLETFIGNLEALPEKHAGEYVHACVRMSNLASEVPPPSDPNATDGASPAARQWLDKAVAYAPDSVEARIHRARLCRRLAETSAEEEANSAPLRELARQDLDAADALGTDDPELRCFLGTEWMALGELDRASAELEAAGRLPQAAVANRFLDVGNWTVAKFLLASELVLRKGTAAQAIPLVQETLAALTEKRQRLQVLAPAVQIYLSAGRTAEARRCLDEYLGLWQTQKQSGASPTELAWLQALVARAEGRPYAVIEALQPVVFTGDSPEPGDLWRLLVEACNETHQPGRALHLLLQGLRRWPQDRQMRVQLAQQYTALGDWDKAFAAAAMAETAEPSNPSLKLLRLGAGVNLALRQADAVDTQRLRKLGDELRELRQALPEEAEIRILQGIVADGLGQPEEAERELKLAMEQCQEPRRAEMQLVRHYRQVGRMDQALGACHAACEHYPEAVEPWLSLAELHLGNADPNAARRCLQQGLGTVVRTADQHTLSVQLALLDFAQGDRTAGVERLRTLAARDRQEVQARALLLQTREIQGDPAAAQTLVAELREAEGESGLGWRLHQAALWLSAANWRAKQQDILSLLQYCRNVDPTWSAPVLLLAALYEKLGDSKQVEETYRTALLQNPAAADIADRLLTLLERQGRLAEAQKILAQIDTSRRLTGTWQVRLAVGAGDLSQAIDLLQTRVSRDNQDALSRVQLAQLVYRKTKDAGQALEYLKEAEALAPDFRPAAAAKAFILQAEGKKTEALQVLDDCITHRPDFEAYWLRAAYLARQGEVERAESDYKRLTTFPERGAMAYQLLGGFYADTHRPDQAVATLEEGLRRHPEDLALQRSLMQLLFRRSEVKDREKAIQILTNLENQLPQDIELMVTRVSQMLTEPTPPSFAEIRGKLESAVKREPTALNAHLALIAVAMRERDYRAACNYAVQALESNPNNSTLLSARSRAELALGYTPMALKLARAALQQDPNDVEALSVLAQGAQASADRKLLGEARVLIDAALGRSPADERLLLVQARVLAALELPKEALPALRAYCRTSAGKSSVAALVTLADLYRLAGDAEEAGAWIEQAERLGTGNQAVVHARCSWLLSQNRLDDLTDIGAAYISAKNQDLTILLQAGTMLAESKSGKLIRQSAKLFEHAAQLFPTSLDARLGWASMLYQTGEGQRAKKVYEEIRQRQPDNVRALNDLAWILQEQDHQYEAALELANRGLRLAPDDIHLLDTRATILANLPDRLTDAKTDFARLAQLLPAQAPQRAQTLLRLGRICVKLNDPDQARQYLQNALEIDRQIHVFTAAERQEIEGVLRPSGP
jgi:tetratricopeptide (TPR) repeat protein